MKKKGVKKKSVKKNRLVILALSVMIGVAGYLNFTAGRKETQENEQAQETNADAEVISYDGDADTVDTETETTEKTETADAEQEALEQAALTENIELNSDEDEIGEAVLTSAQVIKNNMATAKLNREQSRAKSKEALLAVIDDDTASDETKEEAVSSYVKLTDTIEKETDAETVLTAKGYTDCIVTINDTSVDVTLPVSELTDEERAQVEDIVTRKTGYDVSSLVITIAEDK